MIIAVSEVSRCQRAAFRGVIFASWSRLPPGPLSQQLLSACQDSGHLGRARFVRVRCSCLGLDTCDIRSCAVIGFVTRVDYRLAPTHIRNDSAEGAVVIFVLMAKSHRPLTRRSNKGAHWPHCLQPSAGPGSIRNAINTRTTYDASVAWWSPPIIALCPGPNKRKMGLRFRRETLQQEISGSRNIFRLTFDISCSILIAGESSQPVTLSLK